MGKETPEEKDACRTRGLLGKGLCWEVGLTRRKEVPEEGDEEDLVSGEGPGGLGSGMPGRKEAAWEDPTGAWGPTQALDGSFSRRGKINGVTCAELTGRPPGWGGGRDTWSAVPVEGIGDGVKAGSGILGGRGEHGGDAPEPRPR